MSKLINQFPVTYLRRPPSTPDGTKSSLLSVAREPVVLALSGSGLRLTAKGENAEMLDLPYSDIASVGVNFNGGDDVIIVPKSVGAKQSLIPLACLGLYLAVLPVILAVVWYIQRVSSSDNRILRIVGIAAGGGLAMKLVSLPNRLAPAMAVRFGIIRLCPELPTTAKQVVANIENCRKGGAAKAAE